MMSAIVNLLKQTDIFYQFTQAQLELVASICQERNFDTGDVVFFEQSNSDELYIIIQGEIDILINPSLASSQPNDHAGLITIATLRRG